MQAEYRNEMARRGQIVYAVTFAFASAATRAWKLRISWMVGNNDRVIAYNSCFHEALVSSELN